MKLIAIDYGRRRIGLAATDETGILVHGLATIDRRRVENVREALLLLLDREKPDGLVVGLPLDQNEGETAMSAEIRNFFAGLESQLPLPVYYIDESLTSREAQTILLSRRKKERRNKAAVDRLSACLILETFLREHQAP